MIEREDIIRIAREAGLNIPDTRNDLWMPQLERFATLIASRVAAAAKAEEREACAMLVENFAIDMDDEWVCGKAAEAIRAREGAGMNRSRGS